MESNVAIILQARAGSTRLPNKILNCRFDGKSLIEFILERLINEVKCKRLILATTNSDADDKLANIAENYTQLIFRGDEQDVLSRFIQAAEFFGVSKIIRVCADNPLINTDLINKLVSVAEQNEAIDYASFLANNKPGILSHWGIFSELVSLEALKKVDEATSDPLYHEHVTNYIYTHPDDFSVKWIPNENNITIDNSIRLTLDTKNDYENLSRIFEQLSTEQYNNIGHIVNVISQDKELINKMQLQIQNNTK